MHVIRARNVNDAYDLGMNLIQMAGEYHPSRNGPVIRVPDPVTTVYTHSNERVLFDRKRDANPFFHLFEALWMLNGGRDVRTMSQFLPSFKEFSDDGVTFHGAYGHRWRHWPIHTPTYTQEIDQLYSIIGQLRSDPGSRRCVIGMWDPARDCGTLSKDIPCNDLIKVAIVHGALDIQVFCRSNDIVYGAYGANAVHMSVLHEYLAAMIGVPIGRYFQISADFHAYEEKPYQYLSYMPTDQHPYSYEEHLLSPNTNLRVHPLVTVHNFFDRELHNVMQHLAAYSVHTLSKHNFGEFQNLFFPNIVFPMAAAFASYRADQLERAIEIVQAAQNGVTYDWLFAAELWLHRRLMKRRNISSGMNTFVEHPFGQQEAP